MNYNFRIGCIPPPILDGSFLLTFIILSMVVNLLFTVSRVVASLLVGYSPMRSIPQFGSSLLISLSIIVSISMSSVFFATIVL